MKRAYNRIEKKKKQRSKKKGLTNKEVTYFKYFKKCVPGLPVFKLHIRDCPFKPRTKLEELLLNKKIFKRMAEGNRLKTEKKAKLRAYR